MVDDTPGKFCSNCGNPLVPSDSFCSRCGMNMVAQSPVPTLIPQPMPPPRRRSRAIGPVIFAVVIAVVLLAVLLGTNLNNIDLGDLDNGGNPVITSHTYSAGNGSYTYKWNYSGDSYTLKFDLTNDKYEQYLNDPTARRMTYLNNRDLGLKFITSTDSLIVNISTQMNVLKAQAGLDRADAANMALAFVQSIPYAFDNVTHNVEDYWSFPIETLHDRTGDCEDKTFLYVSIMEALNYDTALLFFDDHMAAGLNCTGAYGTYYDVGDIRYYYCETTSTGWHVGDKPEDYGTSYVVVV
jgi:hypothetical protein